MTPEQCKMARAGLGINVRKLGEMASISYTTVTRFENNGNAQILTINKMRDALIGAGIEFISENGGGAGVRLKK
ncbi:MAG: hypothetical protein JKY45_11590 [Emcibacter sp.]|nr:hypothetical protein [Emcibacter sp.]